MPIGGTRPPSRAVAKAAARPLPPSGRARASGTDLAAADLAGAGGGIRRAEGFLSNIGMPPEGELGEGQIAHIAAPTDGGWRVVDVWESEEAFHKFAQTRPGSAMAAAGGPADAPPPRFYQVRNFNSRKR